jgi:asparagine synthase (glutamine-hydrolysing)
MGGVRGMCGIAGFLRPGGFPAADAGSILERMSALLSHRGPDDSGRWVDGPAGIALGHRRLSVLDLSPAGHQPMVSASGRYTIIFNGEIYNHAGMRAEIARPESAPRWRGHSDTEILLSAFDQWGIEESLKKTIGMFAFALWDSQECRLTLARDRLGEKPLYYGWQGDVLLFGSELKALRAHPAFRNGIDRGVLAAYFQHGYIPAPHSIYQGIFKLPPGTYLHFSGQERDGIARPRVYWSLSDVAARGLADPFAGSDAEAVKRLDSELLRAVAGQCIADVPLGAFLSGGTDSSTVVALMQAQSSRPIKTFTIGFHESEYNEAEHAKSLARQLGTDHTELFVTAREAMDVIPRMASIYDEPFGDSSAIPTFLVSQLARRHVTVALSGDGGDELFGGYARYKRTSDIWSVVRRVPLGARKWLSIGANAFSRRSRAMPMRDKVARLAQYLESKNAAAVYRAQMGQRSGARELVIGNGGCVSEPAVQSPFSSDDIYSTMMYVDTSTYLPDDILVKVDRAAMSVGLETRVPMLDHRVVEFAWQLPLRMKVRGRTSKWLLKEVLRKYVPDALPERKKMGFGLPVSQWLRGPLREWAETLLCEDRLRREGFLHPKVAREEWSLHLAGDSTCGDRVWHMLAFQAWLASVA